MCSYNLKFSENGDNHLTFFHLSGLKKEPYTSENIMPPTATSDDLTEASKEIEQYITSNSIMVFSKSYCPFCNKVKQMFGDKGLSFKSIELDEMGQQGVNIQAALLQKTGQKTVPSVFFNSKHIGMLKRVKGFSIQG